ncbi:hypothetical protein H9L41_18050 [Chitinimonas koreensis]|nr:hypothetical protein H9L41_18050 [Chitinimonas koreensis]
MPPAGSSMRPSRSPGRTLAPTCRVKPLSWPAIGAVCCSRARASCNRRRPCCRPSTARAISASDWAWMSASMRWSCRACSSSCVASACWRRACSSAAAETKPAAASGASRP